MHDESSCDVAFSPAVKAIQDRRGSRGAYAKLEAKGGFARLVTPELERNPAHKWSGHGRTGAGIDQLQSPKQICSKFVIDAG
jgi:hypothetical protein